MAELMAMYERLMPGADAHSFLAADPNGDTIWAGWVDCKRAADKAFEACGVRHACHHHRSGESCDDLCFLWPPVEAEAAIPEDPVEEDVVPTGPVAEAIQREVCSHGVGFDRDCGECIQEARLGLRGPKR